ncbi:MAG: molybdopterin-guanine dinucleotide biosynthesis protein B [Gammaproteobacteria bacterium]|nr:molybdopterin-guanine dinucleotide biosynthesis protein B [Gammaproteobacteria bacterium]
MTLAIGVCGYSGAGKTTLLQAVIPELIKQGMRVAVVKHDVHKLHIDHPGKDSDLLFRAGADIYLQSITESFFREQTYNETSITETIRKLNPYYDIILIEGYKHSDIPKIWLLSDNEAKPPAECRSILVTLGRQDDRLRSAIQLIQKQLAEYHQKTIIYANILIGGKSTRMGQAKHLIPHPDQGSWLDHTLSILLPYCHEIILTGKAHIPEHLTYIKHLPDAPNVKGPMSGVLAGMRWAPNVSWILCACDMPMMTEKAIEWMLNQRQIGAWGVLPKRSAQDPAEPLLALYSHHCAPLLEHAATAQQFKLNVLGEHDKIQTPTIPESLLNAWLNMNTPEDWNPDLWN